MGRPANFEVVEDTPERLVLRDIGPWDVHLTVTNDVEGVVARVFERLGKRRLFCYDSSDEYDEILVNDEGHFAGFALADP